MLFLRTAAMVIASLPVALSLPVRAAYKIPFAFNKFLALDTCINPGEFEIQNFTIWTPAAGSNASTIIDFGYFDKDTNIQTTCHFVNGTTPNSMEPGYTPRYACKNPLVEFIWQDESLTMIETACPEDTGTTKFEAAGSATPALDCTATTCGYVYGGDGNFCRANVTDIQADFTSLQPRPHAPSS